MFLAYFVGVIVLGFVAYFVGFRVCLFVVLLKRCLRFVVCCCLVTLFWICLKFGWVKVLWVLALGFG